MNFLHTVPAFALSALVQAINRVVRVLVIAQRPVQAKLDDAAEVAFEAKAAAILSGLEDEAAAIVTLEKMLKDAKLRLSQRKGEALDAVYDAHGQCRGRQHLHREPPAFPRWAVDLEDELWAD